MANLIPSNAKKIVVREYWMRAVTIWMFLVTASCIIITILMIPTYILVGAQQNALMDRLDDVPLKKEDFKIMSEQFAEANELAQHLDQKVSDISVAELIGEIDTIADNGDVTVLEYHFRQEIDSVTQLSVGGIAVNRSALADFRDTLRAHEKIEEVILPLSNLAGDSDIPFSMQVTLQEN